MSVSAGVLRELHRIHQQLSELKGRLQRGPKQIAAGEANLTRLEGESAAAKEGLTRARVASDERQLQLKQREDRIADLQSKLNTCSSNKEYQALKEQIAADEQANSVLSDEILEMLERIDVLQQEASQQASDLATTKEELQKTRDRVSSEQAKLEEQLAGVSAELQRCEAELPRELKVDYDRITKARGEDALAEVEGESCGGCFQMLTPQTMTELIMGKLVFCKSCGCLLYLAEDAERDQ